MEKQMKKKERIEELERNVKYLLGVVKTLSKKYADRS